MKTKLVIFGITGDLSRRKLLPALQHVHKECDELSVIGVSRRDVDVPELLDSALGSRDLQHLVRVHTMDLADRAAYDGLRKDIDLKDDEQALVYLSVPPQSATQIADFLGEAGINTPNVKLLFEKPFGVDLTSAQAVIERTAEYFSEDQLYRIDHYLAKEMAQNIVALRGKNALFSHLWNNASVASIDVIASESIGIEGRGQFYEQTGALRDLVQGHLMQLLALTLMDIPSGFNWDGLPAARLRALEQIETALPGEAIRAQYDGYQAEAENPGSLTETFAAIQLHSTDERWRDVPLRLITGKALAEKRTEIRVKLKPAGDAESNTIIFKIQPNEGVEIELFTKQAGYDRVFERHLLSYAYKAGTRLPDAYEQVLMDAIRGNKNLFTESNEVLASWRILADVQYAWAMDNELLHVYAPGSSFEDITKTPRS